MAHPTRRINNIDRSPLRSLAGGLGEEVALDVVDDDGVLPAEELADRQEPLAASGLGNRQQVANLWPVLGGADLQKVSELGATQQQTCRARGAGDEATNFIKARKPRNMQMLMREKMPDYVAA